MSVDDKKISKKQERFETLKSSMDVIKFKGGVLVKKDAFYRQMDTDEDFDPLAYNLLGAITSGQMKDLEHMIRATAENRTDLAHLISFGPDMVWDTKELDWVTYDSEKTVFASRIEPNTDTAAAMKYMTELANGDVELAWDMLQAIAPIFMDAKPDGVIWFVGEGANGKSSLLNALYKIIGHHFRSMTVAAIENGADAPKLNGILANVCRESSEGRVTDAERYKALGTHESFEVHKFHAQNSIVVTGDLHHIFNANNIPIFNDKTMGVRRRTLIIPFNNTFKSDPLFEKRLFTPEFLGGLLTLILQATHIIRDNNFSYRFSETTEIAKADYDASVNSAEAFYDWCVESRIEMFEDYGQLTWVYEAWCRREGVTPLQQKFRQNIDKVGGVTRKAIRTTVDGTTTPRKKPAFKHWQSSTGLTLQHNGMYVRTESIEPVTPTGSPPVQGELNGDW